MHLATIGFALIAGLASAQVPEQQPKRLNIKVVVASRVHMVQRDENGVIQMRRGYLEANQLASIHEATRRAKEAVESSSGGKVEVSFHSLIDSEPYYVWFDPSRIWVNDLGRPQVRGDYDKDQKLFGAGMVNDMAAPWLNKDGFGTQISANYGPFDAAFVIHAGLTSERSEVQVHNTPVHVLGWYGFTSDEPIAVLAQEMADVAAAKAGIAKVEIPSGNSSGSTGEYAVEVFNDPQNGSALRVTSKGLVPRGGAQIATRGEGYLNLRVRTKSTAPFAIVGYTADHKPLGAALLGPAVERPIEQAHLPTTRYAVPSDNKWHTVSIPVAELGNEVNHIMVAYHPYAASMEFPLSGGSVIDLAAIGFADSPQSGAVAKVEIPAPAAVSVESSALVAALNSKLQIERIRAAWMLCEIKAPQSVATLTSMAQAVDQLESMAAIPALANQDTPEAWAAVKQQLVSGLFDNNRRFAAMAMQGRLTAGDLPDMTPAIAVRSWRTRLEVVKALVAVGTRESAIILSGSLEDPFPQIRTVVVNEIPLNQNLLLPRLLFTAVNDPRDQIRLTTFIRLMDVENEEIRSEALKGVRDEALGVRLGILAAMKEKPQRHYRSAIRVAVTDSSPAVRAAALEALTAQPDAVDPNEIRNTFADSDEAVQLALVKLAKSGHVMLPAEVVQTLKTSAHESVREAAKELE